MFEKVSPTEKSITDEEKEIIELFRRIPEENRNEAIIKLYIFAENSNSTKEM